MGITDEIAKRIRGAVDEALGTRGALRNCRDELDRRQRDDAAVAALARRVPARPDDAAATA